jgi:putative ABC transport system permease protein
MKTLLPLAWASAWNRRLSLTLAALSIALAVALLLSVTRAREAAQTHFAQSVAGVDLVVGPRGSPVQLLLHAVFHLGDASHTLDVEELPGPGGRPADRLEPAPRPG